MTPPFPLSTPLGALTDDLGCFPLAVTELIPRRLTATLAYYWHSEFSWHR